MVAGSTLVGDVSNVSDRVHAGRDVWRGIGRGRVGRVGAIVGDGCRSRGNQPHRAAVVVPDHRPCRRGQARTLGLDGHDVGAQTIFIVYRQVEHAIIVKHAIADWAVAGLSQVKMP